MLLRQSLFTLALAAGVLLTSGAAAPAALAQSASPSQPSLLFKVQGTRLDGSPYTGTAAVLQSGQLYWVAWKTGVETTAGVGVEIGSNSFAVGWGAPTCVVAGYTIQPDGSLKGHWVSANSTTPGTEILTTSGTPEGDLSGTYNVAGSNPDRSTYRGTLEVTPQPPVLQFTWRIGSSSYDGVGVQLGPQIAVGYGTNGQGQGCGVSLFNGSVAEVKGVWGLYGQIASGTENWTIANWPWA
jgi:hypothetical protein